MDYKSALILEGGAMRGVYVSGVLDFFMDNDIYFSSCYGVSAGAKNSQYYPAKQRGEALKVDLFCCQNKKCINPLNMVFKGGIIDAEYYNNYIMKEIAPLDEEAFFNSPMKYYIGTTNCDTGKTEFFEKSSVPDLRKAIVASCSMQVLQDMIEIEGSKYLDGGASQCVAIYEAIKNNENKMVIVLTRSKGFRAKMQSPELNKIYELKYREYPGLLKSLLKSDTDYNECLDLIDKLEAEGIVYVIRPSSPPQVARLERDPKKLEELYNMGYNDAKNSLEGLIEYLNK